MMFMDIFGHFNPLGKMNEDDYYVKSMGVGHILNDKTIHIWIHLAWNLYQRWIDNCNRFKPAGLTV